MTDKRIIVVTGASRGIGEGVCHALARERAHIIAVARSQKALEALDDTVTALGGSTTIVPLDLTDGDGIDRLGGALFERFGRIDGLVANAGVLGNLGPLQSAKPRSFEETIAVNLTANWRLIRSFDPLIRQSEAGRAVFVTSGVVPRPRAFWGPYQASKAGLEAMVTAWAKENENTSLRINLYDPGATRTGMRAEAMPGEDPKTLPTPEIVGADLARLASPDWTGHGERITFRVA